MKRFSVLALFAFAPTLLALPVAAEEPHAADAKSAAALVQRVLIKPLAAKEDDQSRFSRARMPAQERRVRILDEELRKDASGGSFVIFAVDARHGMLPPNDDTGWRRDAIVGCAYVDRGEVFVKSGERYRPAAFLLGKNLKPAAEATCQEAKTS